MSDFESQCLCYARDAMKYEPVYRWYGSILWAIGPLCVVHNDRFATPVWHPRIGQIRQSEGAAESTAPIEVMSSGEASQWTV
jgi:hypothetical protein